MKTSRSWKKWVLRGTLGVIALGVAAGAFAMAYFQALKHNFIRYNEYDVRSEGMLQVGDLAPDLELNDLDGQPHQLSEYFAQRPLVLVFGSYT